MGSHTTFYCDNCKQPVDDLDMYDVHVSIRFPIRDWEEDHEKNTYGPGQDPMPAYMAGAQWCETCYKSKSKDLVSLIGPDTMNSMLHRVYGKRFVPKEFHKQPI
jgi:hypothetical protein